MFLLLVAAFVTTSHVSATSVNFSIVAPQSVAPGDKINVYVNLYGTTGGPGYPVTARIRHSSNGLIDKDGPRMIRPGSHNTFQMAIPVDAEPSASKYTLILEHVSADSRESLRKALPLRVRGDNRIVLIQTDKPVYKPGETVKGRVIVLTRRMTSAEGAVTVTIKNPQSYTMGKFANISLNSGVGPFEFPLSSEPVLGTYECCATYEGLPRGQKSCFTFEVKRYVLPKFSCSITPVDDVVGCDTRQICFSVSADYTYGQSVKGSVTATVRSSSYWNSCPTGEETVFKQIHGKADICVNFCTRYRSCWEDAVINANVTDITSDTTVQCEGRTKVPIRSRPYKLEILDNDGAFTPCHFTTVKVRASTLTGQPKYANVNLTGEVDKRNKNKCRTKSRSLGPLYQKTDEHGIATFRICMSCQTLSVNFRAEVVGDDDVDDKDFSTAYSYRSMVWSREKIVLSTNDSQPEVGSQVKITASFSQRKKAEYYVVSKGLIVARGDCIVKGDKNVWSKHSQMCKRGGVRRTCNITIDVKSFMAPQFTVIVSQQTETAARIVVQVVPDNSSRVSLEFEKAEVRPGDKTILTIRASPQSFIGVVAVDKSVYIEQEKNQLTPSKLYNEAIRFDTQNRLLSDSFICGWRMECPCVCYGPYPRPSGQPTTAVRPLPIFERSVVVPRPSGRPDLNCCPRNCTNPVFYPDYCSYFKASSYFLASGIEMYDSDFSAPEECPKPRYNPPAEPLVRYDCCHPWPIFLRKMSLGPVELMVDSVTNNVRPEMNFAETREGGDDLVAPSRVRQFFPETWLWSEHMLGDNESSVVEKVTVPDTITSWVADAFAVSAAQAMTIARPTTLTVFQPFFVTINLPYSVIRGELVEITVNVFNYLQDETTAYVDLKVKDDEMRVVRGKKDRKLLQLGSRSLVVPPGEGKTIVYYLLPLMNGHLPIQATVRSQAAADSVIRHLLVEPEGVKEEYSQSALMCVEASPGDMCVNRQFNVSLPLNYIPESDSAKVSITANYMGPTIDGLDSLLRLPTGCGEQNMLNFAPAVYIARYLDTVGQLTAEIRKKALLYMQTGYQREMTYQRADGSYSAFGDRDSCGSMWLTAFVVRSFAQADGLIEMSIDPKVQEDAIDYILDQQNKDGSFPPVCKPIHKEMQGCSGGNCSLTAYVTLALLEAGISPKTEAVSNALDYLSTQCIPSDCSNMYTVALVAYTMLKGGRSVEAERALRLLKNCAVTDGDHTYWQYEKTPNCIANSWSYYCRPRSCDVETTAYALLAFTSKEDIAYSLGIVRWLIEQRNPRGGFKSTQDTVVALQALSEYATLTTAGGCVSANVYLTAEELTHKVGVNSGNAMQIQTVQLPKIPTMLSVRVCQVCCILASVGVRYNVPEPDETAAFEVTANVVKQKAACKYEVRVCNRWLSKETDSSNMAVSEVTFFSGFQPVQSELKQLEKIQQCMIKRTEFKGRVLSLYFDEIGRKNCCFTVTMKRASVVADLQGVPVITYNYYEPDQRGGTMIYPREEC